MCNIAGYVGTKPAAPILIEMMKKDKKSLSDKITFIVPIDKKKVEEIKLSVDEVMEIL